MKKRVTIYVEAQDWIRIRKDALDAGVSASQYLIDLAFRDRTKVGKVSNNTQIAQKPKDTEILDEKINKSTISTDGVSDKKEDVPIDFKKAVKLKKATGWTNPLTNTALAPKGGK